MNEKPEEAKQGPDFDKEFKRSAVEMLASGARSATQLASELGISTWSWERWEKLSGRSAPVTSRPGTLGCGGSWR